MWLIPVLVAAILAGAGVTYAVTSGGGRAKAAAPATPSPSDTKSTVFTLPASVDGLPPAADPAIAELMGRLMSAAMPNANVTGAYKDTTDPRKLIVLVGIETPITDPEAEVKNGFYGMRTTLQGLSTPKTYPPGAQGGAMQCAHGEIKPPNATPIPIAVCVVADHKGMMFTLFYSMTEAHAVEVTTTIRPRFETG